MLIVDLMGGTCPDAANIIAKQLRKTVMVDLFGLKDKIKVDGTRIEVIIDVREREKYFLKGYCHAWNDILEGKL